MARSSRRITCAAGSRSSCTAVGTGDFATRGPEVVQPAGRGWEYVLEADIVTNARKWGEEASEKLKAKSVEIGRWDLILHPSQLFLTIHETIGHATELDRAMGYEANYAGTSFIAPPEKVLGSLKLGPEFMNIVGNRSERGALSTIGYDDDGVKPEDFHIVKNGIVRRLPDDARAGAVARVVVQETGRAGHGRTAARMPSRGPTCSSSACLTSRSSPASAICRGTTSSPRPTKASP